MVSATSTSDQQRQTRTLAASEYHSATVIAGSLRGHRPLCDATRMVFELARSWVELDLKGVHGFFL